MFLDIISNGVSSNDLAIVVPSPEEATPKNMSIVAYKKKYYKLLFPFLSKKDKESLLAEFVFPYTRKHDSSLSA